MFRQIVSMLLKNEVAELKRRSAGGVMILLSVTLLGLAMVFGMLALFLWLSTHMLAWQAAMVVFGVILIVALLLGLIGRSKIRRHKRRRDDLDAYVQAALGPHAKSDKTDKTDAPLGVIATAAVAGLIIGRGLSK